MKLIRITNDFWVNPEQITSVFVEMRKIPDTKDYNYPLYVNVTGGYGARCVHIYDTRDEAEFHLLRLIDYIREEAEK